MNPGRAKLVVALAILLLLVGGLSIGAYVYMSDDEESTSDGSEPAAKQARPPKPATTEDEKNEPKKKLSRAEKKRLEAIKKREALIKARARKRNRRAESVDKEGVDKEERDQKTGDQDAPEDEIGAEARDQPEDAGDAQGPGVGVAERRGDTEERSKTNKPETSAKPETKERKAEDWKSAVLQVVTNFDKADITINGIAYPEYIEPGKPDGVVLPAGGPYDVRVTYNGNTKAYRLNLRPNETRLLMVELTGFAGGGAAPPRPPARPEPRPKAEETKKDDKKEEEGKVTVYSKPSGVIIIDGTKSSEKTPGTVEVENGRHEVQVEYEHGEMSEKKIIRVRQGSRIKLFFRARNPPDK